MQERREALHLVGLEHLDAHLGAATSTNVTLTANSAISATKCRHGAPATNSIASVPAT